MIVYFLNLFIFISYFVNKVYSKKIRKEYKIEISRSFKILG